MPGRWLALLVAAASLSAQDGVIRIIVHPQAAAGEFTLRQVAALFLGRATTLGDVPARPMDHALGSPARADFYRRLTGKDVADIDAYWARLAFSGKSTPPERVAGDDEAVARVAASPGAIAYVVGADADDLRARGVAVVLSLGPGR
ncbi:MAG: hypothetical protein RLZZ598_1493 [Pseudomonadota bacterium]|jgi:ABC-type phosphate transport system substrate-binding protein